MFVICVDIPRFVHPSFNGYLGCFHILAIMSNGAVNIHVHLCVDACFTLDVCLEVELLGHMVT